jgi:hypothetical protein
MINLRNLYVILFLTITKCTGKDVTFPRVRESFKSHFATRKVDAGK